MTRAVAYLRRSSSKQEKSISAQRSAVQNYAGERGYTIVKEYVDDGISGDNNAALRQFHQMRDDLTTSHVADVVLVWAYDRISRNDSDEESAAMFPLREAGICVDSVTEGLIDRDSFEGRITHTVRQEGRHSYIRDLAKNSLRGRVNSALQGHIAGQSAPYGFDRMVVDGQGNHILRMKNGDPKPTRGGDTYITLVPSDDPEVVATLRYIFEEYAKPQIGLRTIAGELTERGICGPRGPQRGTENPGRWHANTIKHILSNQNYVGTYVFGKRTEAKFFKVSKDRIEERQKTDYRRSKVRLNDEAEQVIVPNAFTGLIDRKLFDAVQRKLDDQKRGSRQPQVKKPDRYPLAGLVICGCCGGRMYGGPKPHTTDKSASRYFCSTYQKEGSKHKHANGCYHNQIDGDALLKVVTDKIQKSLTPANLKRLESAMRRQVAKRSSQKPDTAPLQRKLDKLNADIDKAADRLLRSDDDLIDILAPKIKAMRQERDRAADMLENERRKSSDSDGERLVSDAMRRLKDFSKQIRSSAPKIKRDAIHMLVDSITLEFQHGWKGKRPFDTLTRGIINSSRTVHREFRGPVELFLASVAEWDAHISHLILAA
ncbi:recombinase family protein [Fuerstiella marisgermanici]|uniref:Recombinase n=1 Tax=Fuerstiella marisgermanici TaxID=1891926 RepID=A0A1P8W919_9PLAN|nr:recombinase family protein [Fuerstiella marisgermanici]APZ90538.1 Recombinase [Fuerstiella marisgermanici]